ncbi:AAA family ATPase [Robiginitomaculum antarcticum]|uniref:AAA family ATPase n=1 Tax=Robiginitomaculum antarcticum TaxID=437507 RepID=UPI0003A8AA96|nr:MoxR family ATPase [Robiginitomaculum antarcticum]
MLDTVASKSVQTAAEKAAVQLTEARAAIGQVVLGQTDVVDLTLSAILCGGHALLVGAPGLAKTLLVETIGTVTGLSNKRVQFTPDLMPADIIGSEVLETGAKGKREFRFIEGPVFTQLLMADEINRASPRTQSALLQAMQEHFVTVAGQRHDLPAPFHVLATQNPIEQEGTYPLPEAQLDRFLFQIDVGYPELDTERAILLATTGANIASTTKVMTPKQLQSLQQLVRKLPIGETIVEAILDLVRNARPDQSRHDFIRDAVTWGPGPRAGQALMLASRARALMDGRLSPSLDDVAALAAPVLKHRMALSFAARADGQNLDGIISKLTKTIG